MSRAPHRILLVSILLVLLSTAASAIGADWLWDATFGGSLADGCNAVCMDAAGNVYVAGAFTDTVDFGGGPRYSAGEEDIFVVKLDPAGAYLWDITTGGPGAVDNANGIAVDADGNILVCGAFEETVDFGGGDRVSVGGQDIFVAKYAPDGAWLWDHTFGNPTEQAAVDVAVDGANDVIITGRFRGPIDFGGGRRPLAGRRDGFVVKVAGADGAYLWDYTIGGVMRDSGRRIAVGADDHLFVVGNFERTVDFGGGPRTEAGNNNYDGYLVELDPDGGYVRDFTWGGMGEDAPWGVALDSYGNVYVAGYFSRTVDFGGGARTSNGSWDISVVKLDPDFGYLWDTVRGGAGADFAYTVDLLGDDHVFVAGNFEGTVDFGSGFRTSAGDADIVLLELDGNGAWLWDGAWGGAGRERVQGVIVDPREELSLAGLFSETVDFGGGDRVSNGFTDGFLARYDVAVPATVTLNPETLNLKSRGRWVTCRIELMAGFDPAGIDVATVLLDGAIPAETKPTAVGDDDEDGIPDLMVKFDRQALIARITGGGEVPLTVTGMIDGENFEGTGSVYVIAPPVLKPDGDEPAAEIREASLAAYPNPFNPTVRIAWSVPRKSRVTVRIWDVNGRLVRTLEDAVRGAGDYHAEWNGRNAVGRPVSAGVYFCRVSIGDRALSRKLMLLR